MILWKHNWIFFIFNLIFILLVRLNNVNGRVLIYRYHKMGISQIVYADILCSFTVSIINTHIVSAQWNDIIISVTKGIIAHISFSQYFHLKVYMVPISFHLFLPSLSTVFIISFFQMMKLLTKTLSIASFNTK